MRKILAILFVTLISGPAWGQALEFLRPITTQTLELGSASASITNALGSFTRVVRVHPTEDAHVAIGATPLTATTSDLLVPADTTEYFLINPGEYIAVIRNATSGVIYITGMTR